MSIRRDRDDAAPYLVTLNLHHMIHVYEVNDIAELAGLGLTWTALLGETPGATFFQSLPWLEVYLRHYGEGQRLRVLAVEAQGRTLGIVPMVVRRERTRIGSLRVLTYPLDDWGTFYGPIGPHPTATLLAALRYLKRSRRDWDVIDLRWIDADGCDHGRTANAMAFAGLAGEKHPWAKGSVIDLDGDWEAYIGQRSAKWRKNARTVERRLAERYGVRIERYRPRGSAHGEDDPRWDLYGECERVAAASWQGDSASGTTLSHEEIRPFLRDVHVAAVANGAADLGLLSLDGRPAAFFSNYVYAGHVFGLRMGFDPEFSSDGVGNALSVFMLRDGFSRGDRSIDLGAGSVQFKRQWATRMVTSYRLSHYRAGMRAQALRWRRRWGQLVSRGEPVQAAG